MTQVTLHLWKVYIYKYLLKQFPVMWLGRIHWMCILNMTDGNSQCVFVYMDCRYLNAALCLSERRTYPANGFLMGAVWCTDQSVLIPAVFVCLSFFSFILGSCVIQHYIVCILPPILTNAWVLPCHHDAWFAWQCWVKQQFLGWKTVQWVPDC